MHEVKLRAAYTFTHSLTSLGKLFSTTQVEQHCEDCVFCPRWRVKECHAKNAWGGRKEGSHLDCGSWFFPEDHGKGNSEHPHNRMLMHRDKCDHGRMGGGSGGYVFSAGEEVRQKIGFGWFVMEEVGASRERTHLRSATLGWCVRRSEEPEHVSSDQSRVNLDLLQWSSFTSLLLVFGERESRPHSNWGGRTKVITSDQVASK